MSAVGWAFAIFGATVFGGLIVWAVIGGIVTKGVTPGRWAAMSHIIVGAVIGLVLLAVLFGVTSSPGIELIRRIRGQR